MQKEDLNTDSDVSNTFAIEAARSYFTARFVYLGGMSLMNGAGFFAHSAIEQYQKAIICKFDPSKSKNISDIKHNLKELRKITYEVTGNELFNTDYMKQLIEDYDAFDQVGRYGANAKFDPLAKKEASFSTKGVSIMTLDSINQLDYFVMVCRKLITITPINMDVIDQAKSRNTKSVLWTNWHLNEITPDDVLTYDNAYFKNM